MSFCIMANTPPISKELFDIMRVYIPKGSKVLELGSGPGSTVELSRFYDLYSVEHNRAYMTFNKPENYIYSYNGQDWYNQEDIKKVTGYKAVLIDGPDTDGRLIPLMEHIDCLDGLVHWFFDDYDLPLIREGINKMPELTGRELITFENCGVKKFAVLLGKGL